MGRLSENEVFKFLELYKKCECLWQSSHKHYRIKSKRNEAYARIKDGMKIGTVMEVKRRIKSFRDTYAAERHKVRKSAVSATHPDEIYTPRLIWYNFADAFLNNPDEILKVNCSISEDSQMEITFDEPSISQDTLDSIYSGLQAPHNNIVINDKQTINQLEVPQMLSPDCHQQYQYNFSPSHQERQLTPRVVSRNDFTPEKTRKRSENQSDEFYHFAMNVAMQLSSLPLVQALKLQTKIQQMLCEERLAYEQSRQEDICYPSRSSFKKPLESNVEFEVVTLGDEGIKEEFLLDDVGESITS